MLNITTPIEFPVVTDMLESCTCIHISLNFFSTSFGKWLGCGRPTSFSFLEQFQIINNVSVNEIIASMYVLFASKCCHLVKKYTKQNHQQDNSALS